MKPDYDGWALRFPDGSLSLDTARLTRDDCWIESFALIAANVPKFEQQWWKRWDASIRAAKKLGYQMVKIRLIEAK